MYATIHTAAVNTPVQNYLYVCASAGYTPGSEITGCNCFFKSYC